MKRGTRAVALLLVAIVLSSCGGSSNSDGLLVMAAASLSDAFGDIEQAFETANPGLDVQLNVAGSASLREQILQGAPADVFASANGATMQAVIEADAAMTADVFAINELQIAFPADNPAGIIGIDDLARESALIGLCTEGVPCGDFARDALEQAGVSVSVDTNENDVRSLLTKIEVGELDAGIVYTTDVASTAKVSGVDLPAGVQVPIEYPIAVLTNAPNESGAAAFVAFVLSNEGQAILRSHGFITP